MHTHRTLVLVIAGAVALAACSSSGGSGSAATTAGGPTTTAAPSHVTPAPKGLPAFYSVADPLPKLPPGTLLKSTVVAAPTLHGTVYRVMYESSDLDNHAVAVTGIVVVPRSAPPAGGYDVVTWGHGTNGMADTCAPSLDPANAAPLANQLLDKGWEITASDYQGEGTPGLLPYISGVIAARNTIDIVRAARQLPAAHASATYVVWGHSEGGQTAMFALDLAATYAPELKLKGVVAGAPPSQFGLIYTFLKTSPYRYYLLMAAGGLNAAYGDTAAPLGEVLTKKGMSYLPLLDQVCSSGLSARLGKVDVATITKADPFTVTAWKKVLQANDPENFATPAAAPLLMIQGGNDEQIPVASTLALANHECSLGQVLERWVYPGRSHAGVIAPSAPDMIHWIADRFAGDKLPDPYVPTGQNDIARLACGS